jgi:hypothetical protein
MFEHPQMTTHQPTSQNRLINIPINRSRRQDSEYVIYISIDTEVKGESYDNYSLLLKAYNNLHNQ